MLERSNTIIIPKPDHNSKHSIDSRKLGQEAGERIRKKIEINHNFENKM